MAESALPSLNDLSKGATPAANQRVMRDKTGKIIAVINQIAANVASLASATSGPSPGQPSGATPPAATPPVVSANVGQRLPAAVVSANVGRLGNGSTRGQSSAAPRAYSVDTTEILKALDELKRDVKELKDKLGATEAAPEQPGIGPNGKFTPGGAKPMASNQAHGDWDKIGRQIDGARRLAAGASGRAAIRRSM